MRFEAKRLVLSLLAAALVWQAVPAYAQRRAAESSNAGGASALNRLFEDEWEWVMRESPTFASSLRRPALQRPLERPEPCGHRAPPAAPH